MIGMDRYVLLNYRSIDTLVCVYVGIFECCLCVRERALEANRRIFCAKNKRSLHYVECGIVGKVITAWMRAYGFLCFGIDTDRIVHWN